MSFFKQAQGEDGIDMMIALNERRGPYSLCRSPHDHKYKIKTYLTLLACVDQHTIASIWFSHGCEFQEIDEALICVELLIHSIIIIIKLLKSSSNMPET